MNDLYFILGIFVFIFLLWLGNGGPLHPIAFTGPILHSGASLPRAASISYGLPTGNNVPSASAPTATQKAPATTPSFGTPSPYRGLVTINHYVSGAGSSNPTHEYVTIRLSSNAPKPVDITGWTLESEATGVSAVIPKGTELPRSGIINAVQPIVLNPGDQAIVDTGRSPIGASFKDNVCIGYFSQYQNFYPTLPQTCPVPYDELKKFYGGIYVRDLACINYTQSLNRCSLVATPPQNLTSTCNAFLTQYLNYNGCVAAHENDKGFEGTTWRIFLGRNKSMWRPRYEVVKLLDSQGKTVDMFSY